MNNFAVLQALAFEPRKAFAELDARPRFWWPLLVVAIASAVVNYWYTAAVDLEWLADIQLRANPLTQNMTSDELARMAQRSAANQGASAILNGVVTLLILPLIMLASALYYSIAGKVTGAERSYRHWLALSAWASIPTLLVLLASAIVLLTASTNQISQSDLQPLSFNSLFLHREPGDPGFTLLTSLNLIQLVSIYLATVGVRVWTGRSWLFSAIFVALPYVLLYGIWAFFSLR